MEHNFPKGNWRKVIVDVRLLVNSMTYTDTRVGEWLNIMGYIQELGKDSVEGQPSHVQALVLWSARSIKLDQYEQALAELTSST